MRHDTSESVRCVMIHRRVSECVMTHDDSKSQRYPSQQAVTQTQSRSGARFTSGPCTSCRRGLLVAMDPSQKRKECKKEQKEVSHRSVCLRLGVVLDIISTILKLFHAQLPQSQYCFTYHHRRIPPRLEELKPVNEPESAKPVLKSTGGLPTHSVELDCVVKKTKSLCKCWHFGGEKIQKSQLKGGKASPRLTYRIATRSCSCGVLRHACLCTLVLPVRYVSMEVFAGSGHLWRHQDSGLCARQHEWVACYRLERTLMGCRRLRNLRHPISVIELTKCRWDSAVHPTQTSACNSISLNWLPLASSI